MATEAELCVSAAELASSLPEVSSVPCVAGLAALYRDRDASTVAGAPQASEAELEALLEYAATLLIFTEHTIVVARAFHYGSWQGVCFAFIVLEPACSNPILIAIVPPPRFPRYAQCCQSWSHARRARRLHFR
jgi:hypothetical protein